MKPNPQHCQVSVALDAIVGKWKIPILIHLLFEGTMRFSELRSRIPEITQKVLTANLRELEEQDIVQRVVYPQVPPKVEYSLTEYGRTLAPILRDLHAWGSRHLIHMRSKQHSERATGS